MFSQALICVAVAVYFEARSEPFIGQSAVAHVIMNRVYDERYPSNPCDVVHQGPTYAWAKHYPIRHKCQFSYYCDGKSDKPNKNSDAWSMAILAATGAVYGMNMDPTEGATHYHAYYVNPEWTSTKTMTIRINDHIFYRWEQDI